MNSLAVLTQHVLNPPPPPQHVLDPCPPPQHVLDPCPPPQHVLNPCPPPQHVLNPCPPPQHVLNPCPPPQHVLDPCPPPQHVLNPCPPPPSTTARAGLMTQVLHPHARCPPSPLSAAPPQVRCALRTQLTALQPVEIVLPRGGCTPCTLRVLKALLRDPVINTLYGTQGEWSPQKTIEVPLLCVFGCACVWPWCMCVGCACVWPWCMCVGCACVGCVCTCFCLPACVCVRVYVIMCGSL